MYLYVIRNGRKGAVKIGIAKNVESRRDTLQTGNPKELFIIAKYPVGSIKRARRIESHLHHLFRSYRIRGEWFEKQLELSRIDGYFNKKQGMNYMDRLELKRIENKDRSK